MHDNDQSPLHTVARMGHRPSEGGVSQDEAIRNPCFLSATQRFSQGVVSPINSADINYGDANIIGEGSVGIVYKARFRGLEVAVKVLKAENASSFELVQNVADFERELVAMSSKLEHPNVIGFIGAGMTESEFPMLVFEYSDVGSVEDFVRSKRKQSGHSWKPPREISLCWCRQLFAAVSYLHTREEPWVHRDIKPANLLLSGNLRTLKLADFSLACPLDDVTTHIAFVPSIAGSFRYMAPELLRRKPFSLEKADVYSATITSWTLIYGHVPFESLENPKDAITQSVKSRRPTVKDPALLQFFASGWHQEPECRPTAQFLLSLIETLPVSGSKQPLGSWVMSKVKALSRASGSKAASLAMATCRFTLPPCAGSKLDGALAAKARV